MIPSDSPASNDPNASVVGSEIAPQIPQHRLLRRIGRGSYGEVWLALNAMKRWTAIKVVRLLSGTNDAAYEQEFRGLKRYDDLGYGDARRMPIRDVGRDDRNGYFYYAMELADDFVTRRPLPRPDAKNETQVESLSSAYRPWTLSVELSRNGRLPPSECIAHGIELAECLESLHQAKLVHRDIKPSNVILVAGRAKLADVGLVAGPDATMLTGVGTQGFVPPEGQGRPAADLYALGKVLFMMSTGLPAGNILLDPEDWDRIPEAEREKLSEIRAVYDRACDPDPRERQPSVVAFREELEMLRQNESVRQRRQWERNAIFWKRTFTAATFAAAAIVTGLVIYQWRKAVGHAEAIRSLEARQFVRMGIRKQGWSSDDAAAVVQAARRQVDATVLRQGVATLSGLDVQLLANWPNAVATSAAFSADGRLALAGFGAQKASLVTPPIGRVQCDPVGEGKVAWNPAGEPILLKVETNTIALRDLVTGRLRRILAIGNGQGSLEQPTGVLGLSRDGRLACAAMIRNGETWVRAWDAVDGTVLGETKAEAGALEFSPDNVLLAIGRIDGKIEVLRVKGFDAEATLPAALEPNPIQCLAFGDDYRVPIDFTPAGKRWLLAAGDRGTGIVIWDLSARVPRATCRGSHWEVSAIAIHPDGNILVSAGRLTTRFWDMATGTLLMEANIHNGSNTRAMAISNDGTMLAVGSSPESGTGDVTLWRLIQNRGISHLSGLTTVVRHVVWSKNGSRIAALADQWLLGIWEVPSGKLIRTFEVSPGIYADNAGIAFSMDADRVAFAAGTQARLFDIAMGSTVGRWTMPTGLGDQLQFDGNGTLVLARRNIGTDPAEQNQWFTYILSPGADPRVLVRQTDSSYLPLTLALVGDAKRLLIYSKDAATRTNVMRLIDLTSGMELWNHQSVTARGWDRLIVDPLGKICVLGGNDGVPKEQLNLDDGRTIARAKNYIALGPMGVEFGIPGEQSSGWDILSTSELGSRAWFLDSGDKSREPVPFAMDKVINMETIAISPDGRYAAWGCHDGSVHVADIEVVRRAVKRLRSRGL